MSQVEKRNRRARPAETGTAAAAAVVTIIAFIFHIDDREVLLALTILVGTVPSGITWLVERRWRAKH